MQNKIRILIVDDQQLFADGLQVVIESRAPQFEVIGIANNGIQAIDIVNNYKPNIVLMDVRMPEMDGVEATKLIHKKYPEIKILILTTFTDDEYVKQSLKYGAVGYLLKNRPAGELVNSIKALSTGIMQIDPAVVDSILNMEKDNQTADSEFTARLHTLSPREREILSLMAGAKRIAGISRELDIAEQTVRNHISNIYFKLNIHDRLEIVNYIDLIRNYLQDKTKNQ